MLGLDYDLCVIIETHNLPHKTLSGVLRAIGFIVGGFPAPGSDLREEKNGASFET